MPKASKPEEELLDLLLQVRNNKKTGGDATRALRKCLLAIGSATPDNLNCVEHLEVGQRRGGNSGPRRERGIKVRARPIMVADIVHTLEGLRMPAPIRKEFPALTQAEWDASLRFVTLLLGSLNHYEWK